MLPGLVAGFYTTDECHVDLSVLCTFASAILIHAEAVGIDTQVCCSVRCALVLRFDMANVLYLAQQMCCTLMWHMCYTM